MLASRVTIAGPTSNAPRRVVGQWGGTGGAICEDHLAFCGELFGFAGAGLTLSAYTMDASEWDAVSKEAKDLVDQLLCVCVEKRATADDVFAHPWMAADARVRQVHLPHFCANRRRYSMRRKFKAAVHAVIAERRLLKLGNVRVVERANTLSATPRSSSRARSRRRTRLERRASRTSKRSCP